ncbi:MAG: nitrous oxide reductase family maturation protein NosD [Gammaproteobacteria bacterium]|nr:nitrous oxide reductase family maturation protein NosD [Gammaproteobacteria bacterium]
MLSRFFLTGICGLYSLLFIGLSFAATHITDPSGESLDEILQYAQAGDTIRFKAGVYSGGSIITQSVHLIGEPGSVFDAQGKGNVLQVRSPDVSIEGFEIRNSGNNLTKMDAGIFVEKEAVNVEIRNNRFENNAFGIWLDGCHYPKVIKNRISGNVAIRSQDRGNGIHLYAVYYGLIKDNEVWNTRDGIYIESSQNNRLIGNFLHDLRYGVHYMYSYSNTVSNNHTLNTRTGYALMQSKFLTVTGNRSENDGNYGILLNFITKSTITDNVIIGTRKGRGYASGGAGVTGAEGKAFFVYNSHFNIMTNNHLQGADIGIHLTAGSEDNIIYGNDFIGNHVQVKYVATRTQEWSQQGKGNYWSDYLGWDLDADGIGDRPYEPNDAVDKLLWRYPLARILLNSPAIETLRWVQEHFPVLRPQGVRDSYPLMKPGFPQEIDS